MNNAICKTVYYIDHPRCFLQIDWKNQANDILFYVVEPRLVDELTQFGIDESLIITPLHLLTLSEDHHSIFELYTKFEIAIKDEYSYIGYLLSNQILIIDCLIQIMCARFSDVHYQIISFRPSLNFKYRLNSGIPQVVYYANRDHILTCFSRSCEQISFYSVKYSYSSSFLLSAFYFAFRLIYYANSLVKGLLDVRAIRPIIFGSGVPAKTHDQLKTSNPATLYILPLSECNIRQAKVDARYFLDFPNRVETFHWFSLIKDVVSTYLGATAAKTCPAQSVNEFLIKYHQSTINDIYNRTSKAYKQYAVLSAELFISDHINLYTFGILNAARLSCSAIRLLPHGVDRLSNICLQLINSSIIPNAYPSKPVYGCTSTHSPETIIPPGSNFVIVSYAFYKRTGFKARPVYLRHFVSFATDMFHDRSISTRSRCFIAKKPNSEALSSNSDLYAPFKQFPLTTVKTISDAMPRATIIAIGHIGMAHINLVKSGHTLLYFGSCTEQAPLVLHEIGYNVLPDGSLLLAPKPADVVDKPSFLFCAHPL